MDECNTSFRWDGTGYIDGKRKMATYGPHVTISRK